MTNNTFTSIAEDIGVTEGAIRNVFSDYVNELERTISIREAPMNGH